VVAFILIQLRHLLNRLLISSSESRPPLTTKDRATSRQANKQNAMPHYYRLKSSALTRQTDWQNHLPRQANGPNHPTTTDEIILLLKHILKMQQSKF